MNSINGVSIGVIVSKDDQYTTKEHATRGNTQEGSIHFINMERHKRFVKNMFSIYDPVSKGNNSKK